MYVALDTSTDTAGIALVGDDGIVAEMTWRSGQNHTTQLLANLSYMLRQSKLNLKSAKGIIVARGPGSYNGLRVGISAAKGMAFSLGVPIVGISTMEAEAYQHAEDGLPVCPVFNAGRGELAVAIYQKKGGQWQQLIAESLIRLDDLVPRIATKTVFCGDFLPSIAGQLKERLGEKAVIASPAAGLRRAAYLAELGMKRLDAGDHDSPATLQPLYLRGPSITQPKRHPG